MVAVVQFYLELHFRGALELSMGLWLQPFQIGRASFLPLSVFPRVEVRKEGLSQQSSVLLPGPSAGKQLRSTRPSDIHSPVPCQVCHSPAVADPPLPSPPHNAPVVSVLLQKQSVPGASQRSREAPPFWKRFSFPPAGGRSCL